MSDVLDLSLPGEGHASERAPGVSAARTNRTAHTHHTETHAAVVAACLREQRERPRAWSKRLRVVDLFAGAGGASWGATLAGANVVGAVNHDAAMLAAHARALPWTAHICEDVERLSPLAVPAHDCLWASFECTGFTRARGTERLHHDASRATAWAAVKVADYHRPPVVLCENVTDLRRWDLLRAWLVAWDCLGYVEDTAAPNASLDSARFDAGEHGMVLNSADFGVPQARERLFFVLRDARQVSRPVDLSAPPALPHVPVRDVIDFDTSRGFWSPWRDHVENTRARIEAELARSGSPCLVAYHGSEKAGRALDRPCGTLDRNDRYRVIVGDMGRLLRVPELLAIGGFPHDYPVPPQHREGVRAIGASVVPAVARWLVGRAIKAVNSGRQ